LSEPINHVTNNGYGSDGIVAGTVDDDDDDDAVGINWDDV
jgi:hypothetical protein